jgi:hypothetical protein
MKVAIADAPALLLPALSQAAAAQYCRLAGLLLAVGVPVLFWTSALAVLGNALGIAIGPAALAAAGLAIGTCCLIVASVAMAGRLEQDRF